LNKLLTIFFLPFFAFSSIQFDGYVKDDEWSDAEIYDLPYEIDPSYNTDAEHSTDVLIKNDDSNLYVAFKAYGNKEFIRANIRSRDGINWLDDQVAIGIDTFGDGRYYIRFSANPLGSIGDNKVDNNDDFDGSYNVEFDAKAHITDYGYEVEFKIPFSSLNFPEGAPQKWKLMLSRKLYNKGLESRYLNYKKIDGAGCIICQSTDSYLVENIVKKNKKRIIPSFTTNSVRQKNSEGNMNEEPINSDISIGGEYELKGNTFEFTINPDFSQVEADQSKININSTTALRFEERRIFFNEGKDFLSSDLSTVYTRSINNPDYAMKVYNRGEKHSYYFLDAEDAQTPIIVPGYQRSYSGLLGKSHANIFSYNYNIEKGQNIGFLATNRDFEEGGNSSLFSLKGNFLFNEIYNTRFELVSTAMDEPISDIINTTNVSKEHTYNLDGESFEGYGGVFGISRDTENWSTRYYFATKSPNYRSDLGFTTENNWKKHSVEHKYKYRSDGFVRKGNVEIRKDLMQDYDGVIIDQETVLSARVELKNQFNVNFSWDNSHKISQEGFVFNDVKDYNFGVSYSPSEKFWMRFGYDWGDSVARNIDVPEIGKRTNYSFNSSFQINDQFRLQYNFRKNQLENQTTKENYFSGYITSLKGTYQLDKDSFFKVVHEYNNFNDDSYTQALFQWQPDSATIFYFGGTIDQEDIEGTWEVEGSQIYMKLQYLFNFD
jgi:hypothetical protein